jgi:hypothetical protein
MVEDFHNVYLLLGYIYMFSEPRKVIYIGRGCRKGEGYST